MASVVYPKYKEAILGAASNTTLLTGTVRAVLIDVADYTYDAGHDMLNDVPAGARVSTSASLGNRSVTNGVFDAEDTLFPLATGDQAEAIIIYIDTGNEATSRLVAYIDSAGGLPVTPNGQDINVAWDNGPSKIFAL